MTWFCPFGIDWVVGSLAFAIAVTSCDPSVCAVVLIFYRLFLPQRQAVWASTGATLLMSIYYQLSVAVYTECNSLKVSSIYICFVFFGGWRFWCFPIFFFFYYWHFNNATCSVRQVQFSFTCPRQALMLSPDSQFDSCLLSVLFNIWTWHASHLAKCHYCSISRVFLSCRHRWVISNWWNNTAGSAVQQKWSPSISVSISLYKCELSGEGAKHV